MEKIKIMVVDDNEDILFSVKEGLGSISNYDVQTLNRAKKCIEMIEAGEIPNLILLDIMMPEMDGWELVSRLKRNDVWKDIPVIFLTAKTDDLSKGLGSLTSEDYIVKPFDNEDLKKRIDKVFNK